MQRTSFAIFGILAVAASIPAHADTIFEVEHARANARAGLVSEYDAELLDRWGATSGTPAYRKYNSNRYKKEWPRKQWIRARR